MKLASSCTVSCELQPKAGRTKPKTLKAQQRGSTGSRVAYVRQLHPNGRTVRMPVRLASGAKRNLLARAISWLGAASRGLRRGRDLRCASSVPKSYVRVSMRVDGRNMRNRGAALRGKSNFIDCFTVVVYGLFHLQSRKDGQVSVGTKK